MNYHFYIDSFDERKIIDSARQWVKGKNVHNIKCVPTHIDFGMLLFESQLSSEIYSHKNLTSEEKNQIADLQEEIESLRQCFKERHQNSDKQQDLDKFIQLKKRISDILGEDRRKAICRTFSRYGEMKAVIGILKYLNQKLNKRLKNRCIVCGTQMSKIACSECGVMYCSSGCRKDDRERHINECSKYKDE